MRCSCSRPAEAEAEAEAERSPADPAVSPLDRTRPLWELDVVEGLAGGRVALVTKVHQALVDGVHAVDLGQVLLDDAMSTTPAPPDTWRPSGALVS